MRIRVFSDLHREMEPFDPDSIDCDAIVLAGDIDVKGRGLEWAKTAFNGLPVLYVVGNHEYYGRAYPKHVNDLKQAAFGTNVHVLENDTVTIGSVTFFGCSLWTDFELMGDPRIAGYEATTCMTDYKKIRLSPSYRRMRSIDTATIHRRSRRWLQQALTCHEGQSRVVITHHAPSPRSLLPGYENDLVSAAYASELDEFVAASGANLWIHGHTHNARDYRIGDTRVLCNPKGYPGERTGWDPRLTVEI